MQAQPETIRQLAGQTLVPLKGKQPFVRGWTEAESFSDAAWQEASRYGVRLDGLVVIDIDRRPPDHYKPMLEAIETLWVRTPSGGQHVYLRGTLTGSVPAPGWCDIKHGGGHQCVGPGNEGYVVFHNAPIADLSAAFDVLATIKNERAAAVVPHGTVSRKPEPCDANDNKLLALNGLSWHLYLLGWPIEKAQSIMRHANGLLDVPIDDGRMTNETELRRGSW